MTKNEQDVTIHADARRAFNEKAESCVGMIVEKAATAQHRLPDFKIDVEPKAVIGESDISNLKLIGTTDPIGREISKSFEGNGKTYEISGPSYIEMMKFIDQVAKVTTVCDALSRNFIRDNLFSWLEARFKESAITDWISFLMDSANQVMQSHEVWIPISELHVQSDIQLGKVTFSNLSKQVFERDILSKFDVEALPKLKRDEVFRSLSQRYQGLAVARLRTWSEPTKAVEVARKETEISLKLLTCYHPAWCMGELVSSSAPKGEEYIPKHHAIIFDKNGSPKIIQGIDLLPFTWKIDNEYLAFMKSHGLETIHQLRLNQDSEFQRKALDFFVGYGGSFMSRSVSEKILRLVVALEKFLSPGSDEPTQTTIADRLAFAIGTDQGDRLRIVKTTKVIYGWRSRLVHSALEISEEQDLDEFLRDVWRLFILLATSLDQFSTMKEFYQHLDEIKYGAPV